MKRRIAMTVSGVTLCAISVAFFRYAAFGMDAFQVFVNGMGEVVPIGYGTLYVIINVALLLFALVFDRHYIGLATFINLFLLGYIAEFSLYILNQFFPNPGLLLRILFLIIGIVILSLSSALYYTSDLGVSTYDAIALVMANKWKVAKFRYCRIGADLCVLILGSIFYFWGNQSFSGLGAFVGIGTIITAFCLGPLIEVFTKTVAEPWLYKNSVL